MSATLGVLLDSLGPELVRPVTLPRGTDVPVGGPVIYDPAEPPAGLEGAVLLAASRPSADVLPKLVEAGVAAVIVKSDDERWASAGTAVLRAAPEVSWGQLYTLIDALLAVAGPFGPGEPADLFTLANQIAARVGGAVAIEDLAMRILAYSTIEGQRIDDLRRDGILGRRVPEHPTHVEEYTAVLRSDGAIWSREPREFLPRLAIAVRARGEALGTIWAVEADRPLAPDAAEVLAEAAVAAAPHLARVNLDADEVRRRRTEQLGRLLRGLGPTEELAAAFGLPAGKPVTVVAISRGDHAVDAVYAGDLLRSAFAAYRVRAAAGAVDGRAYAIVSADSRAPLLHRITADALAQANERLGDGWRAGIGRSVPLVAVPESLRQAEAALRVLYSHLGRGDIGRHEDLAAPLLLLDVGTAMRELPALTGEPLARVTEHDRRHGTDYLHSLRAWIASHYDVPRAAEVLSLHPNTLRYRLRRIGELIDIDDPDTRLVLALQLRLRGDSHA
ncbi:MULTISPECIES: PucR family transcriptional regulator [Nonomuraea]|uniref:PucR family transcriptional regulator n=1 Tax=Nonomuraea mangrovi TaxID=2316207 RepID=A0ABW4SUE1_9ACTN